MKFNEVEKSMLRNLIIYKIKKFEKEIIIIIKILIISILSQNKVFKYIDSR